MIPIRTALKRFLLVDDTFFFLGSILICPNEPVATVVTSEEAQCFPNTF